MLALFKKKFFWFVFFVFNLLLFKSLYFSKYFYFLSLLIFIFNVLPLINFYYFYKKINYIPLYYFTHIYFFCCYTCAVFFPEYVISIFDYDTLRSNYSNNTLLQRELFEKAMEIYILGLIFFNFGSYNVSKFFKRKAENSDYYDFSKNYNEILILGFLSYGVSSIFIFSESFDILQKIYQIKYPLTYLAILSLQIYLIFKKNINNYLKVLIYFIIFLILFLELLDGSVAKSFLFLISIYLMNFLITKKINFKIILSIVFISFVIHTFKYEYRNVIWGSANLNSSLNNYEYALEQSLKKQNLIDKSKNFFKTYSSSISRFNYNSAFKKNSQFLSRNISRLTHSFQSLLIVSTLSPEKISYWDGYSYKILATKIIPRIFWENKPSDNLGNEFGVRYGVLDEKNYTTSWNMPVLNELYVNFGIIGIAVGMFFLGIVYNLVSLTLNYNYKNYLFIISFITLYPLFYLESHLSITFGAVPQTFLFLYIYIYLYKKILSLIKRSY